MTIIRLKLVLKTMKKGFQTDGFFPLKYHLDPPALFS